ncbi:hypothetical protein F4774DRAFT_375104 [Daldinia eschscholtzii]|nr:hypothetical protein F4774DRAFT_375104 [Daldinia eschscholtzii]
MYAALPLGLAYTHVYRDTDRPICRRVLFGHDFGNSYEAPYVVAYSPLSFVSSGSQYDSFEALCPGDIEIRWTSDVMPIQSGINKR